ncbi:MAG: hypothetical protein EOM46_08900 [Gammaproteobacteria bacterium]|nr:hypothetical protein [Gammaproteobacteria bacterium]
MKQALQLPSSAPAPQLLPVKIQDGLLPASEVGVPVESSSSLTLSFCTGTQPFIQQIRRDLLRTVLESLR